MCVCVCVCVYIHTYTHTYICIGLHVGWDSIVGIATRYGLDGPGIESPVAPFQIGPEAHPASCTMGTGSSRGVKRPGRGAVYPPRPSTEVKV
jgi:hypothetical protein